MHLHVKSLLPAVLLVVAVCCMPSGAVSATALDDYVAEEDPSYGFVVEHTRHREGYTVAAIRMVSQSWRFPDEVDRTLWEHDLLIAVPWVTHSGNQHTALLIVNGGGNTASATGENDQLLGLLATVTGSVVAMVSQVPNQPLHFADEAPASRIEDALLAYGMDKYLLTGDPEWLVHLPMTKAVVRAMDTVQTFAAETRFRWLSVPEIRDFIVLGGSKRGWATWLTAAVEAQKAGASRVRGIALASVDLLNLDEQFMHHWEAYGFYAPAIGDYDAFDLPCRALTPGGQAMLEIIDPFAYRDRLTMPKLILNSAGDQFFLPDSSQFYFAALPGPKQLRYTLNTDHAQAQDLTAMILPTLSWLSDVLDNKQSPGYSWDLEPDGAIRVRTDRQPERVRLWQATNPNARDFRLESIGAAWTSTELQPNAAGEYVGYVPPPVQGWTAYTVELTFPGSTLLPTPLESQQIFTTDVQVTPAELPFRFEDSGCVYYQGPIWLPDSPASANHAWTAVGVPTLFEGPIVLAGPPTFHGHNPGVVRLQGVSDLGFELRFQEYDYRERDLGDTYHVIEDIPYAVLERGRHVMSDGSVWEVGSFELGGTGDWIDVDFGAAFAAPPHVFLTVQTNHDAEAVSVRARNVGADGFQAALFEEEALMDGHALETVGYLAVYSADGGGHVEVDGAAVPYLLQTVTADHRWVPVLSQRLRLEEERSRDWETAHVDETVHVLAFGQQLFAQQVSHFGGDTTALRRLEPTRDAPMEWGIIRGVDHTWQTLPFANVYTDPVIVAKPVSSKGGDPGVIRLSDVSGAHAKLRYQEWLGYLDGWHLPEAIFYLVSEAGQHGLGGLAVEANWLLTNKLGRAGQWEDVLFNQSFQAERPVVLSAVMTEHGADPVITRIRDLDAAGFSVAMDEQESKDDGHVIERLGWVAIGAGSAITSDGRRLATFFAPIDHNPSAVAFPGSTAHRHPSVIADINSAYGMDPVSLRYADLTNAQLSLKLSEEQSADTETWHVLEDVGIFMSE